MVYIGSTLKIEVGKDWKSNFKSKFPLELRVEYLKEMLNKLGYQSDFNLGNKKYIIHSDSFKYYGYYSLSEYRKVASKLIKFKVFK